MRRVVVHEILIGAGLPLLLVAGLVAGAAERDLGRFEREAAELRAAIPAEGWEKREGWEEARRRIEEAEFNVRATLELRRRLWRPTGMAAIATAGGLAFLVGAALTRRRNASSSG